MASDDSEALITGALLTLRFLETPKAVDIILSKHLYLDLDLASYSKQIVTFTKMAVVLPVTSFFLGLHTLYFVIISFRVAIYRGNNMQKDKNYEQGAEFQFRNAAQTNFAQYFPVIMLFLGLLEANAVLSERYLLVVATAITALRVMHTLQLAFPKQLPIGFRMLGFIGTIAFFAVFSILCILVGLQEFGLVDRNLLGNNRSWLGFADDKYAQASDNVKSGWNTIKDKAQDL